MDTRINNPPAGQTRNYLLKELVSCSLDQQMAVREIRNHDDVRSAMYTDHIIGVNEHLAWIKKLRTDHRQVVWAILKNGSQPVGVVSLNAIDKLHRKADWAFYIAGTERGGLGSALEYCLLEYFFRQMDFEKLNCEVLETNSAVVSLHKRFGFTEEGLRRHNIIKAGIRIGVVLLGLCKDEWLQHRSVVLDSYGPKLAKFSISFAEAEEAGQSIVDQIEHARAKNNVNWMALLRLCLEVNPETAKLIIKEIMALDKHISDLTGQLVNGEDASCREET